MAADTERAIVVILNTLNKEREDCTNFRHSFVCCFSVKNRRVNDAFSSCVYPVDHSRVLFADSVADLVTDCSQRAVLLVIAR